MNPALNAGMIVVSIIVGSLLGGGASLLTIRELERRKARRS